MHPTPTGNPTGRPSTPACPTRARPKRTRPPSASRRPTWKLTAPRGGSTSSPVTRRWAGAGPRSAPSSSACWRRQGGRFDVIVCWKSDRLSRGMFPAAALMEVVEAHQLRIESVMDAIDMKTFGLMAAIGKIELDNFRERAAMGKRGAAKQGRISTGRPPYGYRVDASGRPEVVEAEADVVRRIFRDYVHRGLGA